MIEYSGIWKDFWVWVKILHNQLRLKVSRYSPNHRGLGTLIAKGGGVQNVYAFCFLNLKLGYNVYLHHYVSIHHDTIDSIGIILRSEPGSLGASIPKNPSVNSCSRIFSLICKHLVDVTGPLEPLVQRGQPNEYLRNII